MGFFDFLKKESKKYPIYSSSNECKEEHQWESSGKCKRTCIICGKTEGDLDFRKVGGHYGHVGSSQMFQDYVCSKCGRKQSVKVSDSISPNLGFSLGLTSILGIGPEEELNRKI